MEGSASRFAFLIATPNSVDRMDVGGAAARAGMVFSATAARAYPKMFRIVQGKNVDPTELVVHVVPVERTRSVRLGNAS